MNQMSQKNLKIWDKNESNSSFSLKNRHQLEKSCAVGCGRQPTFDSPKTREWAKAGKSGKNSHKW
jgi:hypothetical protein